MKTLPYRETDGSDTAVRRMSWTALDSQMADFRNELCETVKIDEAKVARLATEISAEVRFLPVEKKDELRLATPIDLSLRLEELSAFQGFMDITRSSRLDSKPEIMRAKVLVQNYVCFVYLSEACFLVLRKNMPNGSVTKKCAKFLTDNPIRSFRNAIAHANWRYAEDFSGLQYWARKGADPDEPLSKHTVDQADLAFWQALSRCVAYAAFSNL